MEESIKDPRENAKNQSTPPTETGGVDPIVKKIGS